jgi:hypothetical protein
MQNNSIQPTAHHSAQGHMTKLDTQDHGGAVCFQKCSGMIAAKRFRPWTGMAWIEHHLLPRTGSRFAFQASNVWPRCCFLDFEIILSRVLSLLRNQNYTHTQLLVGHLWDAPPLLPWGVGGPPVTFTRQHKRDGRQEGRHREARVLSRRLEVLSW